MILEKLYKKLLEAGELESSAVSKPPTHPEYPDYVSGPAFKIRSGSPTSLLGDLYSYLTARFVLPRNVEHDELGFNIGLTGGQGVIGGSNITFLSEADANKFISKYLPDDYVITYASRSESKLIRVDNYGEIPCYLDVNGQLLSEKVDSKRISKNLLDRLENTNSNFVYNPFAPKAATSEKAFDKAILNIDEKIELMKQYCSKVDTLFDYKNIKDLYTDRIIAKGVIDKGLNKDFYKRWNIKKSIPLTVIIKIRKSKITFQMEPDMSYNLPLDFNLNFNLNLLDEEEQLNIKSKSLSRIFVSLISKELDYDIRATEMFCDIKSKSNKLHKFYVSISRGELSSGITLNNKDLSSNGLQVLIEELNRIDSAIMNAFNECKKITPEPFSIDDQDE